MLINIDNLFQREKHKYFIDEDIDNFNKFDNYFILTPIITKGFVLYSQDKINIELDLEYKVEYFCSRCLKKAYRVVKSHLSEKYDKDELLDIFQEYIDISEIVNEYVVMNYPIKILCSDECKGLCNVCGIDLNLNQCDCMKDEYNDKFKILSKLLITDEEK